MPRKFWYHYGSLGLFILLQTACQPTVAVTATRAIEPSPTASSIPVSVPSPTVSPVSTSVIAPEALWT